MHPQKRITIYELGRIAKTSIATVSRALNPHTRYKVALVTRNRIIKLASRHHYTPNLAAHHLGSTAFRTVGVILPHRPGVFFSHYYMKILAGVSDALWETDYRFKLILLKETSLGWDRYHFRTGESVDGVIVTHRHGLFSNASTLKQLGIPCVAVSDPEPDLGVPCVANDNRLGGDLAARHLLAHGHRRIAVLTGPANSSDSRLRVEGFRAALRRANARAAVSVYQADFSRERARVVIRSLQKHLSDVTALFCCNDEMAFGALDALHDLGLRCPEDLSVLGYDDDPRSATTSPPLTTIHVPLYEIAKEATRQLVRHLTAPTGRSPQPTSVLLPVNFVERASVASLRRGVGGTPHSKPGTRNQGESDGHP